MADLILPHGDIYAGERRLTINVRWYYTYEIGISNMQCTVEDLTDIHRRTLSLRDKAFVMKQEFLVYLYEMAIRELENKLGSKCDHHTSQPISPDVEIKELAERLLHLASANRGR